MRQVREKFGAHVHIVQWQSTADNSLNADDENRMTSALWHAMREEYLLQMAIDEALINSENKNGAPQTSVNSCANNLRSEDLTVYYQAFQHIVATTDLIMNMHVFMQAFVLYSLAPCLEQVIQRNLEVLSLAKRSLSHRLYNVKKYFAGSSNLSAGSVANTEESQNVTVYSSNTILMRIRRLADTCILVRDYSGALLAYDVLQKELFNEKAWHLLPGVQVIIQVRADLFSSSSLEIPSKICCFCSVPYTLFISNFLFYFI